jgi:hypothetical protein
MTDKARVTDDARLLASVRKRQRSGGPVSWSEAIKASGPKLGPYEVAASFVGDDWSDPGVLTFSTIHEGYEVSVDYTLGADGRPEYLGHHVRPLTVREPIGDRALARFGLAKLQDQIVKELQRPDTLWGLPGAWIDAAMRPASRGRRSNPEWRYAVWVWRYERAMEVDSRRPMVVLTDWFPDEGGEGVIRAYLNKAVVKGLKEKAPPGRAGGGLTEKGKAALAEAPRELLEVPTYGVD